jgi:uncharacterized protein (TIGR03118 family)
MRLDLVRLPGLLVVAMLPCSAGSIYFQNNLVSDVTGMAPGIDSKLVNPWGLSSSGTSPWWISDNGAGVATLYNGAGVKQALTVTIPPMDSSPTGQVFNPTTDFKIGGVKANFLFATEDGTIAGWTGGTSAATEVMTPDAVYKGLALANNGTANLLYAANFHSGTIDVFDASFAPVTVPGGFTDPSLPAGYAPFNIQNLGGKLYVTYAVPDADKKDDVAGAGHGIVNVFDANGVLLTRLVTMGPLDSPWGLALAPANFGDFSNDLLVGNFGNGMINAFDAANGAFLGTLGDGLGNPLVIPGLWGLAFGNGAGAGPTNALFFTAGIPGGGAIEDHGLFGAIAAVPEPGTAALAMLALLTLGAGLRRSRSQARWGAPRSSASLS